MNLRDIAGYEGLYAVSDCGQVVRTSGAQSTHAGRRLKQAKNRTGYHQVTLSKGSKLKNFRVHRLVCAAFLPRREGADSVNHKDGDKSNNALTNLEWVTHSENMLHAHRVLRIGISPAAYAHTATQARGPSGGFI